MLRIMLELRWTHVRKRHFPCRHYMEKREDPGDEVVATVSARSQRVATLACNWVFSGAPKENIVQNHLIIALLNALIFSIWTVDIGIFLSPKNISSVPIS